MKNARVIFEKNVFNVIVKTDTLLLSDGRTITINDVETWLPPLPPTQHTRTILALGLNYIDHAKELSFIPPLEPLSFMKSESSLTGHRQTTPRPIGVQFMHYECELVMVIGKTARRVQREHAHEYISGYTIANDYVVRDYLENWYRPNLRAKNRDKSTPIGPWVVDAGDISNVMDLEITSTVNGKVTQSGNTKDMIYSPLFLLEYFSRFMTLSPGDIILTGTPNGVVDCQKGDVVINQIEGIGSLINTIA